ncbi:hypothetical protein HELRODRAFT_81167 [Helobdella robusta]|uniref:Aminopeptidase n=1 Tax=Helobdella robusta TaxID=6412 RepID=T1G4A5_HELRO|nr:hypothetical protein HELRODRAFT_81167 [Helobdella robusta]ESO02908.1 hypothetical protein HELRODRAFT_81167 [Helobdella robusta]
MAGALIFCILLIIILTALLFTNILNCYNLPPLISTITDKLTSKNNVDSTEDSTLNKKNSADNQISPFEPWPHLRLPRTINPTRYNISLDINLVDFVFHGSVDILVEVHENTSWIILHATAIHIKNSSVEVVKKNFPHESIAISRLYSNGSNEMYAIQTVDMLIKNSCYIIKFRNFSGILGDELKGLYRSSYQSFDGSTKYLAVSQLQSTDARRVFPCFDEPDMKAVFAVAIRHHRNYTALSNMAVRRRTFDGEAVLVEFHDTPIMSTYLLAFLVADFVNKSIENSNGFKIQVWSRRDLEEQTSYALEFVNKTYEFFSDYFGCSEVVTKTDHVAVPDFSAGAMENWGLVFYRETSMLHDNNSSSIPNMYWVSLVMAHEISHSWFGNMVTMKWWDDLWLNEGFANTLMFLALDHFEKNWKVFDLQLVSYIHPVMTKDSLNTSHAVSTAIIHLDNITTSFDAISYDKGMALLRMLNGFLGAENFKNGLKNYIKKFKFSNANMSQLWSIFESSSEQKIEVGKIMNTWTLQMGFPVVIIKHIRNNLYLIDQKRFLMNAQDSYEVQSSPYQYKWIIPFMYKIEDDDAVHTVWINDSSLFKMKIPSNKWVLGNINSTGLYRVNYEINQWKLIIKQLYRNHKVFSVANRAGLINDAFNLARANMLPYEIVLNLSMYLYKEDDYVPWKAFFDSMEFIEDMLSTSNFYGKLKNLLRKLIIPKLPKNLDLMEDKDLLKINFDQLMLSQAIRSNIKHVIQWAKQKFEDWMYSNAKIPTHYTFEIYSVGVMKGDEKEWDFVWDKVRKTLIASDVEYLMNALAYSQQQWLLWRYASYSLNNSLIKVQDVRNLFKYFTATPLSRSISLEFLLTNWDEICLKFESDAFLLRDVICYTMTSINSEYHHQQLKELFTARPPPGVALKSFENALALIRSNINWMNLNQESIGRWFNTYSLETFVTQMTN